MYPYVVAGIGDIFLRLVFLPYKEEWVFMPSTFEVSQRHLELIGANDLI